MYENPLTPHVKQSQRISRYSLLSLLQNRNTLSRKLKYIIKYFLLHRIGNENKESSLEQWEGDVNYRQKNYLNTSF